MELYYLLSVESLKFRFITIFCSNAGKCLEMASPAEKERKRREFRFPGHRYDYTKAVDETRLFFSTNHNCFKMLRCR